MPSGRFLKPETAVRPFIFDYPIFVLSPRALPGNAISVLRVSGVPSIAVFTDSDLAERSAEKFGVQILVVKNSGEFLLMLEDLEGVAENVIFDPEQGQTRPANLSISALIEQIRADED
jgi:hypothetical protein